MCAKVYLIFLHLQSEKFMQRVWEAGNSAGRPRNDENRVTDLARRPRLRRLVLAESNQTATGVPQPEAQGLAESAI